MSEKQALEKGIAASINVKGYTAQGIGVVKTLRAFFTGGVDTGGGVLSIPNPESTPILITRGIINVTTAATGANSVEVGTASTATGTGTNLISSQDVHSSTGAFGSSATTILLPAGQFITISTASGASAGLAGGSLSRIHEDLMPITVEGLQGVLSRKMGTPCWRPRT